MRFRIAFARVFLSLGWAGVAGLALLALALYMVVQTCLMRPAELPVSPVSPDVPLTPVVSPAPILTLPSRDDVPSVLAAIESAAVTAELGWPAAEYRVVAATDSEPARLEVRSQLKGSYPKVRGLVSRLMADVRGLTLREFSLSRPNAETADVDARLTFAVFLRDAGAPAAIAETKERP